MMSNEEFEKLVKESRQLIDEINAMNEEIDKSEELSVWDIS